MRLGCAGSDPDGVRAGRKMGLAVRARGELEHGGSGGGENSGVVGST